MAGKPKKMHPDTKSDVDDVVALKKQFIEWAKKGGILGWAASKVGRDIRTIERSRKDDVEFDQAVMDAVQHSTDVLRQNIYLRASNPADRFSAVLAIFELKRRDPSYRDRVDIHGRLVHGGAINTGPKVDSDTRALLKGMTKEALQKMAEDL